jgi:hypothetical protein
MMNTTEYWEGFFCNTELLYILTIQDIYGPMIYTATYIMFLLRANPLRGQVGGGWDLEVETFLGPVKWHRAIRRVPFG